MALHLPVSFSDHTAIQTMLIQSESIYFHCDSKGRLAGKRYCCVGAVVMLRESLSREEIESSPQYGRLNSSEDVRDNPRFGVLTWIQPEKEVQDMPRLCEIWEIYTKQRILKRCSTGEVKNAQEIKEHMKHMPSYYAWISDDHSHFYLKDVLTTPTLDELLVHMRLDPSFSLLHIDKKSLVYEFMDGGLV